MIITQKYHSSSEIDSEFIGSLEELLQDQIPSFEWIKIKEKAAAENVHFTYFLFFGKTRNSPIGYAQVSIVNEETEKAVLGSLFKKKERIKKVCWSAPTATEEGVVFDPAFLKGGLVKTLQIFEEYSKRKEIVFQSAKLSDLCLDHSTLNKKLPDKKRKIANCLVKNKSNYKEYLEGLSSAERLKVERLWKEVYRNKSYRIGEYEHFKECFEYKKRGSEQYKQSRKNGQLKAFADQADLFLTFESPDEVFAIVFLFYGASGHIFFKPWAIEADVKTEILVQTAIMRFFEEENSAKLRFLDCVDFDEQLQAWGFTGKVVHHVTLKK